MVHDIFFPQEKQNITISMHDISKGSENGKKIDFAKKNFFLTRFCDVIDHENQENGIGVF